MIKKCPHYEECTFGHTGICNVLPVFYATKDFNVVGCTKDILRKKLVKKHIDVLTVERWEVVFPASRCEFEVKEITLD
jgi:hypothetical protein